MAIPTQFSVAKTRKCPIANPAQPVDGVNPLTAEDVGFISGASTLPAKAAGDIGTPSELSAQLASDIDSPNGLSALSVADINNAVSLSAQPVQDIDNASLFGALSVATISNPSIIAAESVAPVDNASVLDAESESVISAPTPFTAKAGTLVAPPFPLNHARILFDNKLVVNEGYSATNGGSSAINALKPNTWERWEFTGASTLTVQFTFNRQIDTICIGGHNLGSKLRSISVEYSTTTSGEDFVEFAPSKNPTTDAAIMFHNVSAPFMRRVRVIVAGGGDVYVAYISGGLALQMQRPFFNGHQPYTDSDVTEYYSNRTESGEIIGRQIRRKGYETSYEWQNIDDAWYRENIPIFKERAKTGPMFIAWNLLEYPNDVAFGETTGDISTSMQNGTRTRRNGLSFTLRGV